MDLCRLLLLEVTLAEADEGGPEEVDRVTAWLMAARGTGVSEISLGVTLVMSVKFFIRTTVLGGCC